VFVYEPESNTTVRWTQSEMGAIDPASLASAELVRYPTWDRVGGRQRMLSALIYKPRGTGPHPVLIHIPEEPQAQQRPDFNPFVQFLTNELGYAVVAPNVRGTSGYGKTFAKLDDGALREDAVKDIGSLLVWLGLQSTFDRERVVVMGTSYGGYMALASLAAYGDRLRGGIDAGGISNFVNFLQNTAPSHRKLHRQEYGDERDTRMRGFLTRISPLNNAAAIQRPLFVAHGLSGPGVQATDAEQLVARVRSKGGEVWYLAVKNAGPGADAKNPGPRADEKRNRDTYLEVAAMFLEKLARR
jgi:dipeptidyl aminopeptidase/acylaminoacyl peptidase